MRDPAILASVEFILEYDDSNLNYFRIKNKSIGFYLTAGAENGALIYQTNNDGSSAFQWEYTSDK